MTDVVHRNNFGFLRLLFATFVMVSHSAEIIDGNRSREALMFLTGGRVTFGEVGVDAFFIISGFLVLKSYENSSTVLLYFQKRIRRIYPGFLVAFAICTFAVAPAADVRLSALSLREWAGTIINAALLNPPNIPAFYGLPVHALNGSMWSIAVEFRCYILIVLFGTIGLYRHRWFLLIVTIALLAASELNYAPTFPGPLIRVLGFPPFMIRMIPMFCVGSLFYLFKMEIQYRAWMALVAAASLIFLLHLSIIPEFAIAIFGGYLIFWCALGFRSLVLAGINSATDISYGVYLYAWPIQCVLAYHFQIHSPWILLGASLPLTFVAGFLSWHLVESRLIAKPSAMRILNQQDNAAEIARS